LIESDRRKDEFLATLAHELRNPLAPIRYAVNVVGLKGPETPELRWAVDIIERQTQHMARLIDDLLDVNRITRNTLELRKEAVELSTIVSTAVEASQPVIEKNQQKLVVDMPQEPILLDADTVRLAQVFSNLLHNASKYSKQPEGGGTIWLTAERDQTTATVAVRDNGIGIAPTMLSKVFDMFTQVGRSRGQSEGGLGIGLALAKRLVEMHGGVIEACSDGLGKGSEFVVRLPVKQAAREEASPSAGPSSSPDRQKRRILIADDNPDVIESFQLMLQMMGHEVETALDGLEAIEKAGQFQPEAIVLDIGMPGLDGLETARRIRQQSWGKRAVLIAITGWGNDANKRESAEAGFDVHLVKPVDPMTIVSTLDKIDESKARRGA
jgi:CheY-like chemotaxis protein